MHEPWLTSIFPSGGQYHWVSEFAPKRHQRFLSFLTGWLSVLGWQTSLVGTAYTAALAIQGLVALNTVDYAVPGELMFSCSSLFAMEIQRFLKVMRTLC